MWLALGPVADGASFQSLSIMFLNRFTLKYCSINLLLTLFTVHPFAVQLFITCPLMSTWMLPADVASFVTFDHTVLSRFVTGQLFTQEIFGLQRFVILLYSSSFYSSTFTVQTIVLLRKLRLRFHCIPCNHLLSYI